MIDRATESVLVFNGELFGAEPLRRALESRGHRFSGKSDTEILLVALREWGIPGALNRIRGQFAFAYLSARSNELLLARDRVGIRPLYFAQLADKLAFASEQKSLLHLRWVDRTPHQPQLLRYLTLGRTDDIPLETMLRGVQSLPAGHWARWVDGGLAIERYDRIDTQPGPSTIADVSRELRRAVEEQLVGEVPMGAMVSGGVDSSAVALLADQVRADRGSSEPFHIFLYHDQRAEHDERAYQQAVLASFKTAHSVHWVSSSPEEFRLLFDLYVEHQEEPYGDISSFAEFVIAREAKSVGVKVLLGGLGGDEVFLGYPWFLGSLTLELTTQRKFATLRSLMGSVAEVTGQSPLGQLRVLLASGYYALPASFRNALMAGRSARSTHLPLGALAAASSDAWHSFHAFDGRGRTNATLRSAIESSCIPRFLLHSDRVCLASGVEGRVPLLDDGVVRAAFGVPIGERVGESGLKRTLREAVRDVLPAEVLNRRWKLGFHAPLVPYVEAIEPRLRAGMDRTARALQMPPPEWVGLAAALKWRWGALGEYLNWVERHPT